MLTELLYICLGLIGVITLVFTLVLITFVGLGFLVGWFGERDMSDPLESVIDWSIERGKQFRRKRDERGRS